jgi:two-component system response regulator FixJ
MAVRAMRAGALDFLQKPFNEQVLIDWIQTAIQRRESARDRADGADEVRRRLASLTPREREVLDAVMEGKANKVIAVDFGVSLKTVEQHRSRMMSKLGVRKVADIFRLLQGADPPDAGGALLG